MKLFAFRRPPAWPLLLAAMLFLALSFSKPDAGSPLRRFVIAFVVIALGLIRIVPVENAFLEMRRAIVARAQTDRAPAPLWAYAFLIGFIALIIWIGRKTMYSE